MNVSQAMTEFFQRPSVISALSALGGFALSSLVNHLRSRVKELEYSVDHEKIGLSSEDEIFGSVRVSWQGNELVNLYLSTLTLNNSTTHDLESFIFKIFTGKETLLLSERTEISGTSYSLHWSPAFAGRMDVAPGQTPTVAQFEEHRHTREYLVPTLNKGQTLRVQVLTTVPESQADPSVWADCLYPGVRTRHVPIEPSTLGVPNRLVQPIGLATAIAVTVAASYSFASVWLVAAVSCFVGLSAILLGALLVRAFRALRRIAFG